MTTVLAVGLVEGGGKGSGNLKSLSLDAALVSADVWGVPDLDVRFLEDTQTQAIGSIEVLSKRNWYLQLRWVEDVSESGWWNSDTHIIAYNSVIVILNLIAFIGDSLMVY